MRFVFNFSFLDENKPGCFQLWVADGARDMRSKNFQNMRHQPLLNGSPDALILELIVPPELHLMLGLYCH